MGKSVDYGFFGEGQWVVQDNVSNQYFGIFETDEDAVTWASKYFEDWYVFKVINPDKMEMKT